MGPLIRTIDLIVVGRDRVVAHPPRDLIRTVDSDCAAERERERVDHDPGTADLGSDDQERMRFWIGRPISPRTSSAQVFCK